MCRCQEGYRGARCELKHVNSSIPVGTVTLVIGAVIILIIIIALVIINKRFTRFESILLATEKQKNSNGVLGQKLIGQQQANGHPASGHKYLQSDGQVNMDSGQAGTDTHPSESPRPRPPWPRVAQSSTGEVTPPRPHSP